MPPKSLWSDLSDLDKVISPKSILQDQAFILTKATNGVLMGNVDDREIPGSFGYDFDVRVPLLNNYTYTILRIDYDIDLYPVRVRAERPPTDTSCDDEEEFVNAIAAILSSEEIKSVVAKLVSQAT